MAAQANKKPCLGSTRRYHCQLWPKYVHVALGREIQRFHMHLLMLLLLKHQKHKQMLMKSDSLATTYILYLGYIEVAKRNRNIRPVPPVCKTYFPQMYPCPPPPPLKKCLRNLWMPRSQNEFASKTVSNIKKVFFEPHQGNSGNLLLFWSCKNPVNIILLII